MTTVAQQFAAIAIDDAAREARIAALEAATGTPTPTPTYPQFSLASIQTLTEGGAVTATVTTPVCTVGGSVQFGVAPASGSTGSAADWANGMLPTATFTFPASSVPQTQTQTFLTTDDVAVEGSEAFVGSLSAASSGATIVSGSQTFTVLDNDGASVGLAPTSVAQPANTRRYTLLTTTAPATLAKGTGADAGKFTLVGSVLSIEPTAYASGANTFTCPIVVTPTGGGSAQTVNVVFTLSDIAAPVAVSSSFVADFGGNQGVSLITKAGWSATYADPANVPGDPLSVLFNGDGTATAHDTADMNTLVSTNFAAGGAGATADVKFSSPTAGATLVVAIFAQDAKNSLQVAFRQYGQSVRIFKNVNGVRTLIDEHSVGHGPGFAYQRFQFTLSVDGASLRVHQIGSNGGNDADYTVAVPAGVPLGNRFGFQNINASDAYNIEVIVREFSVRKGGANMLAITRAELGGSGNTIRAHGTWAGAKPNYLQHRSKKSGESDSFDFVTGVSTINSDGTWDYTADFPALAQFDGITIREGSDTGTFATSSSAIFTGRGSASFGFNLGPTAYFFRAPTPIVDFFRASAVDTGGAGNIAIAQSGSNGTYDWQTNTGVTIQAGTSASAASTGNTTVVSSDPTTGKHVVTIGEPATLLTPGEQRGFKFTGGPITQSTISRRTTTGIVDPAWRDAQLASDIGFRVIDYVGTNNPLDNGARVTAAQLPKSTDLSYLSAQYGINYPMDVLAKMFAARRAGNPNYKLFYLPERPDIDDDAADAQAQLLAQHLPPDAILVHEAGNEMWNFPRVANSFAIQGFARGHLGVTPIPTNKYKVGGYGNGDRTDGAGGQTLIPAVSAGDYAFYNLGGTGNQVYKAKTDLAAGSNLTNTNQWELAHNAVAVQTMVYRYAAKRHLEWIAIYENRLGAARVRPAMMGQLGNLAGITGNPMNIQIQEPGYLNKLFYIGGAIYYYDDLPTGNSSYTRQQFTDGWNTSLPLRLAAARNQAIEALSYGKTPLAYEGGPHVGALNYPAPYALAWFDAFTSDAGRVIERKWVEGVRDNWPGPLFRYNDFGGVWGQRDNLYDNSPAFVGFQQGLIS